MNCSSKQFHKKAETIGDDRYTEVLNGSEGYKDNSDIVNRYLFNLWPGIIRFLDRNRSIISMVGEVFFLLEMNGQDFLGPFCSTPSLLSIASKVRTDGVSECSRSSNSPEEVSAPSQQFVDTLLLEGDAKREVLEAIIEFARTSGLKTIADGVETQEQVEHLRKRGVYAIQGYVYARPIGKEKVEAPLQGQSA